MHKAFLAVFLAFFAMGHGGASEKADVMGTIHQIVDAFNGGDSAKFLAACAKETSIVDEVPPHEWHGADGCAQWMKDYGVFVQKQKIEDAVTTLGNIHRIQISDGNAYVVISAKCDYKQMGESVHENVIVTLALHKVDTGWRLTAWVWARL